MGLLGAAIGGVVGGAIGATVWAAIVYFTNYELGIIAWGIGVLVGVGARVGAGEQAGFANGILAACIAVGAIAIGKFAAIHFLVTDAEAGFVQELEREITDRHNDDGMWVLYVADQVIEERTSKGQTIDWPGGAEPEERKNESHYPADVITDAKARWEHMTPDARESYKASVEAGFRAAMANEMRVDSNAVREAAFSQSWGFLDIVFVLLAVFSAFKLGSGSEGEE